MHERRESGSPYGGPAQAPFITHSRQDFVDINIAGTLNLLEEAASVGTGSFVFTSTTSVFGDALVPPAHAPAAWITEDVRRYAAEKGIDESAAIGRGLQEKAKEFQETGAEVYAKP